MKCPKCGADVIGTEKFCNACGNEISLPATEPTPQVVDSIQTETEVNQAVSPVSEPTVNQQTEMVSEPVAPAAPVSEPVVSQPTEVVSQPVEPMAAPVTPEVVNTPVEPMVQPVVEPVAEPVAQPVVEQPVASEPVVEQANVGEVPVESPQPVEAVAPVSEPTVEQPTQMASEPTLSTEIPASMEAPVTAEVPASAPSDGEPPKKKSSKGLLIVVIIILVAALGVGGYYVYNQYFVEGSDDETNGGDVVDSDTLDDPTSINTFLICNRLSGDFNSVVNLEYEEGKLSSYGMSYNASTYGMEEDEMNNIIAQYNNLVAEVSVFENETGFNLYISDSVDQETGSHTMNVNYTIDLIVATNPDMLALVGDQDMTIEAQTTALEADGYTCS